MLPALANLSILPAHAQLITERSNRGLVEIVAGSADGTGVHMVEDLAEVFDDGGTRRVLPVVSKGTLQSVFDLRSLRGIDMALVQTDVLDDIKQKRLYLGIEHQLSYIAKLYTEEFHLLGGPEINSVKDLAGKKVNTGVAGDGTAVTARAVFGMLDVPVETTSYDPRTALAKLRSGEIAALAIVAAKPVPLFANLRPEDGLHFVPVPLGRQLLETYMPGRLTAEDYPLLSNLRQPIDTVAVSCVLMAINFPADSERYRNMAAFVDAFFTQFPRLLERGWHPKWQEVNLSAELPGWRRFPPAEAWLKRNAVAAAGPNEQQMREIFSRFIDERSRTTGRPLSAQQKNDLFSEFKRWERGQAQ
jgi:TRAP-type uncharacterized transport system substrate-binding protein